VTDRPVLRFRRIIERDVASGVGHRLGYLRCPLYPEGKGSQSRLCVWHLNWPTAILQLNRGGKMPVYSPELISIMRAALNQAITSLPADQATPGVKAFVAEVILKTAATGQTNYD
jgi:hypothetical protein